MKVAILGGGLTGLTAAYYLRQNNFQVSLFEKESVLGGMASGFKEKNWDWYLERTYHHLFANDNDILNFAKEIGFNEIFFKSPETASLYLKTNFQFPITNYQFQIYPLDTPFDFLRFPLLSFKEKLRAGATLGFLKFSPFLKLYEKATSEQLLKKFMGEKSWQVLFLELFRKKFGKYAGNILASFFWARIKKRTKNLGYIKGGFQNLIDFLEDKLIKMGVEIRKKATVIRVEKRKGIFEAIFLNGEREKFDLIISTLPTPVLTKLGENLLPASYLKNLKKINYLHAMTLIIEAKKPVLEKTYWLNISVSEIPIMGIIQHTNFIEKKHYGGKHLCYLGWYLDEKDKLWLMSKEEVLNFVLPYIEKLSNFSRKAGSRFAEQFPISNFCLFKVPYAQPIFDRDFIKNKPDFKTPVENFYLANLDMTYPYDRGTNFAVKLGKEVAQIILSEKTR